MTCELIMPHNRNHHKVKRGVRSQSDTASEKSTALQRMQRRAAGWLKDSAAVKCPALTHVLKRYTSLKGMPIQQSYGCDLPQPHSPQQWREPKPQLPQHASVIHTTDQTGRQHKYGWTYMIIGSQSPRGFYGGGLTWSPLTHTPV